MAATLPAPILIGKTALKDRSQWWAFLVIGLLSSASFLPCYLGADLIDPGIASILNSTARFRRFNRGRDALR